MVRGAFEHGTHIGGPVTIAVSFFEVARHLLHDLGGQQDEGQSGRTPEVVLAEGQRRFVSSVCFHLCCCHLRDWTGKRMLMPMMAGELSETWV